MPSDFEAVGDNMQRAAGDEARANISADRRESARIELTEALESLLSERRLGDLGTRVSAAREN